MVKKHTQEFLVLIVSCVLLGVFIGEVTGIHYDEAFVISQSKQIGAGERPLSGMTSYSGALHQYLLVPFFEIFGYKIEVLRAGSLFFNTFAVALIMYLIKKLYPTTGINKLAGILLCTSPAFVMISRYAGEVQCLNAFLTILSLVFFYHSITTRKGLSFPFALLGGLTLGILAYNHFIGLVVLISLILSTSIVYGFHWLKTSIPWSGGIGFLGGISVWMYQFTFGSLANSWTEKAARGSFTELLTDIANLPGILNKVLNGGLLYNLFVGRVEYYVVPYITIAFFSLLGYRILCRQQFKFSQAECFLFLFTLFLVFFTILVAPNFSPHYFLLPVYSFTVLLSLLSKPLIAHGNNWMKSVSYGLLGIIVAFNIFYVATNYFISYRKTGGNLSIFSIGNRVTTTSNCWVQTYDLFRQLKEKGVKVVFTDLSIRSPLYILDTDNSIPEFADYDRIPRSVSALKNNVAVIFYNGINLVRKNRYTPPDSGTIRYGEVLYEADSSFDKHFKVFLAGPN
ncbi:MAG: hypothetical protein FJ264_12450 [Planctomycetes bacterium]|nr:hypothetical protein [Planctomycetota bacterium]